ncbi:MAG TPA: 23S rRNA (pseudouridine(1915)-N(3))-methyltransferase RlmH [Hyphomicrobiales bacterium]|nr:23S rRNA (pseudouridine(1915)-N(3))-methyltransferase RlmH [Hyphomicrobiales bacterium]
MRLLIAAVGRLKAGPERELWARYLERAGQTGRGVALGPIEIAELAESRERRPEDRRREETAALIAACPPGYRRVVLDEGGQALSSRAFADWLDRRRTEAAGLAFLVGGADGLDRNVAGDAAMVLAFGAMTWPHQLARIMLAEQLYRAATLIAGHPYHRA